MHALQLYINGVLVLQTSEAVYRSTSALTLDGMMFSTFFGGDTSAWATPGDQYSYFKNFRIYKYNY